MPMSCSTSWLPPRESKTSWVMVYGNSTLTDKQLLDWWEIRLLFEPGLFWTCVFGHVTHNLTYCCREHSGHHRNLINQLYFLFLSITVLCSSWVEFASHTRARTYMCVRQITLIYQHSKFVSISEVLLHIMHWWPNSHGVSAFTFIFYAWKHYDCSVAFFALQLCFFFVHFWLDFIWKQPCHFRMWINNDYSETVTGLVTVTSSFGPNSLSDFWQLCTLTLPGLS